jgi:hypothetical protein
MVPGRAFCSCPVLQSGQGNNRAYFRGTGKKDIPGLFYQEMIPEEELLQGLFFIRSRIRISR